MTMRHTTLLLLMLTVAMTSCKVSTTNSNATTTPATPDYRDSTQWYIADRGAAADVFYIISTETGDYTLADGSTGHWADTYSDSLRAPLYSEMVGVDTLVSGALNFYSPYIPHLNTMQVHSEPLIALVVVCTVCPLPSATLVVPTTPWAFLMRAIENTMELSDEPELNWLAILKWRISPKRHYDGKG